MSSLTVANQLTLFRLLLVPALVLLVLYGFNGWAFLAFAVAGITDALDGLIARRTGQRTRLGALLDPMADKLLLASPFVVFVHDPHVYWWASTHRRTSKLRVAASSQKDDLTNAGIRSMFSMHPEIHSL